MAASRHWLISWLPSAATLLTRYPSAPQPAGQPRLVNLLRATHRVRQPEAWSSNSSPPSRNRCRPALRLLLAWWRASPSSCTSPVRRENLEKEIERAFFALPEASIIKSAGDRPARGADLIDIGDIRQFRTQPNWPRTPLVPPAPIWDSIRGNRMTRFVTTASERFAAFAV